MNEYYVVTGRGDTSYALGEDGLKIVVDMYKENPYIHSIAVYKMVDYYERDDDEGWEV